MTRAEQSERLRAEVERAWPHAQAYWSRFLLLNDPDLSGEAASVAQIRLSTRQVTLNDSLIIKHGLIDCGHGDGHRAIPGRVQTLNLP